jgi:hypothetical protein
MSAGASSAADAEGPPLRLRWYASLLLLVCFASGVVAFAAVGFVVGSKVGAAWAQKVPLAPPTRGLGFAPDLRGIIQLAEQVVRSGVSVLLGIASGTGAGCVVMWVACRQLIAPRLRAVRCLTRR